MIAKIIAAAMEEDDSDSAEEDSDSSDSDEVDPRKKRKCERYEAPFVVEARK